jgi:hypothetical protein
MSNSTNDKIFDDILEEALEKFKDPDKALEWAEKQYNERIHD